MGREVSRMLRTFFMTGSRSLGACDYIDYLCYIHESTRILPVHVEMKNTKEFKGRF